MSDRLLALATGPRPSPRARGASARGPCGWPEEKASQSSKERTGLQDEEGHEDQNVEPEGARLSHRVSPLGRRDSPRSREHHDVRRSYLPAKVWIFSLGPPSRTSRSHTFALWVSARARTRSCDLLSRKCQPSEASSASSRKKLARCSLRFMAVRARVLERGIP